jgi:biopolymer transport protein TolQ
MSSFQGISARGSASLAVVAPGISEALVATATGLAAAIPAVVAYNHFAGQIRRAAVDMDVFSQDFLNLVQQSYLGTGRD